MQTGFVMVRAHVGKRRHKQWTGKFKTLNKAFTNYECTSLTMTCIEVFWISRFIVSDAVSLRVHGPLGSQNSLQSPFSWRIFFHRRTAPATGALLSTIILSKRGVDMRSSQSFSDFQKPQPSLFRLEWSLFTFHKRLCTPWCVDQLM